MERIQLIYNKILNPFSKGSKKQKWDALVMGCFFVVFLCILIGYAKKKAFQGDDGQYSNLAEFIFGISNVQMICVCGIILTIAIIFSAIRNEFSLVVWNEPFFYIWVFTGLLIILSGCFHAIGEGCVISQCLSVLLFPLLFFVWQGSDELDRFFALISWPLVLLVILFGIVSLLQFPFGEDTILNNTLRYESFLNNPNRLGFFSTAGSIASVYLGIYLSSKWSLIPCSSLGFCFLFVWLSGSRSSLFAILAVLLVALMFSIRSRIQMKHICFFIVYTILVCFLFGLGIRWNEEGQAEDPYNVSRFVSMVYAEEDDGSVEDLSSGEPVVEDVTTMDRIAGNDGSGFTSGRIWCWKAFAQVLNMSGHDVNYYLPIRTKNEDTGETIFFDLAHNSALEVAFRSGLVVGILYVLVELLALLYVIATLLRRRKPKTADLFACMAIVAFLLVGSVESLVETRNDIFSTDLTLLFYLSMGSVFAFDFNIYRTRILGIIQKNRNNPA